MLLSTLCSSSSVPAGKVPFSCYQCVAVTSAVSWYNRGNVFVDKIEDGRYWVRVPLEKNITITRQIAAADTIIYLQKTADEVVTTSVNNDEDKTDESSQDKNEEKKIVNTILPGKRE